MLSIFSCACLPYVCLLWRNVCLDLWPIFLIGSFIFLELSCRCCLYIFEINSLSVALFAIIFSHSEGCLFTFLTLSFIVDYCHTSLQVSLVLSLPTHSLFWTVVLEKTLESPLDCKKIQPVHSKGNQSWIFIGRTDAEVEAPILWPPDSKSWLIWEDWCWKRLKTGREGDNRGWDGWMASPTQWTWVWVNARSWWWTERPGVLQSMGSQRAGHNLVTD